MNQYKREHLQRWGFLRSFYAYCLLKLHHNFGFRLYLIRSRDLHANGIERLDEQGLMFRRAERDEILTAANRAELELEPAIATFALDRGDLCFGAFHGERLVAYSWCSMLSTPIDEHLSIEFSERAVYRYKSFVLPEFRGRNLLAFLNRLTDKPFIDAGRSICISYVDSHNFPMLRASARAGYRRIGLLALTEYPHKFRLWCSPGARQLGVRFVENVTDWPN